MHVVHKVIFSTLLTYLVADLDGLSCGSLTSNTCMVIQFPYKNIICFHNRMFDSIICYSTVHRKYSGKNFDEACK